MWIYLAELLPDEPYGLAIFFNFLGSVLVVETVPYLVKSSFGILGAFLIYFGFCVLTLIGMVVYMPETVGKNQHEIYESITEQRNKALPCCVEEREKLLD